MSTRSPMPAPPALRGSRAHPLFLVLLAASLPMFMATLDNLVMTGALPVIARELHPSVEQLQWFVNAYTLAFATLMLPAATLGDRLGRRRVFLAGTALFTLASVAAALSTSPEALVTARAVQGVGAAAIMPLSLTLLAGAVPPRLRPMAIGVWGGVSGLGVALGPLVGGAVVEGLSWQAIFWLNVPVAFVAVPLAAVVLRESLGEHRRLDLLGLTLAGTGVLVGVWAIVDANEAGWGSVRTVGMLALSVLLLGAFVVRQARTDHPLVPLGLFRSRTFSVANVAGLAFSLGMFGAVFLLTQFLQISEGYTPLEAGVRTLPWTAAPMVVAPLAGLAAGRVGVRLPIVSGLVLQTAALAWMAVVIDDGGGYAQIVPAMVLAGVGMGLTFAPIATAVLAGVRDADHATASSVNSTVREVGVALGVAVLTAVFLAAGGAFTPQAYLDGLVPALWVGASAVAVGVLAALFLPGRTTDLEAARGSAQAVAAPPAMAAAPAAS
jgi:EmrB/QacA subfamily drug resistance transporter